MRRPAAIARPDARLVALATALAATLAAAVVPVLSWRPPAADTGGWTALLPTPRVHRLRAAIVTDARDCPATLAVADWFTRPALAAAVGGVAIVVRDGRDSLTRYADALLTAPVQLAVVPLPVRLRDAARRLGPGPRLLLVDPAGQVAWATRIPNDPDALAATLRAALGVANHYVATELVTTRTLP